MTTIEQAFDLRFDSASLGSIKDLQGCGPIKIKSTIPTNRFDRLFNLDVFYEDGEFRLGWIADFYPVKVKLYGQEEPVYTVSRVSIALLNGPRFCSRLDKLLPYRPTVTLHSFYLATVETALPATEEVLSAALPHKEDNGLYSIGWMSHRDLEDVKGEPIVFQDVESAQLAAKYANNLTKVPNKQPAWAGLLTNVCISGLVASASGSLAFRHVYYAPKLTFFGWVASRLFGFPFESPRAQAWDQRLDKAALAARYFVSRALWGTNGRPAPKGSLMRGETTVAQDILDWKESAQASLGVTE